MQSKNVKGVIFTAKVISYDNLWILLIKRKLKRIDLRTLCGISSVTLSKLGKNEHVSTEILERLCTALDCNLTDIMEMIDDENETPQKSILEKKAPANPVSYARLWAFLEKQKLKPTDLIALCGISSAMVGRLARNEVVSNVTLRTICKGLQCNVSDIMETLGDGEEKSTENISENSVSYNKLWLLLEERKLKSVDLIAICNFNSALIGKLERNEHLPTVALNAICKGLQCNVSDIMEIIIDDKPAAVKGNTAGMPEKATPAGKENREEEET